MRNTTLIATLIILALIIAGAVWWIRSQTEETQTLSPTLSPTPTLTVTPSESPASITTTIVYNGSAFSPNSLTVKSGTVVVFRNESSGTVWPASAFHPTHGEYPVSGGCIGSTFDACRALNPGESWPFKFDAKGTWQYHNHLNASQTGQIIVE